jgi:hypothetical protein
MGKIAPFMFLCANITITIKLFGYVPRDWENILHGYLYGGDLLFVIMKGIYGFKFPKRFLEISSRDLTSFLL